MPFSSNADLPAKVRELLPDEHAQAIYRAAFNSILARIGDESRAFAGAYAAVEKAGYKRGKEGKYRKEAMAKQEHVELEFAIAKSVPDERLVFGWASVVEEDGQDVIDKQGDIISTADIEKAAYDFVLNARGAGEMHERIGVGQLVESVALTREKQEAMGIKLNKSGWWLGFRVDPDVFAKVKSGELQAFSIGGSGKRAAA
jgi:cation transport regulator ChaB